jgi:hypothetical protein
MKKYDIDQYVKGKVGNISTPYSEGDWKSMEAMLDEDSGGVLFFFRKYAVLLILLVLSLGGGACFMFSDGVVDQNTLSSNTIENEVITADDTEITTTEINPSIEEVDTFDAESSEEKIVLAEEEQVIERIISSHTDVTTDGSGIGTEAVQPSEPIISLEPSENDLPIKVETPRIQIESPPAKKATLSDIETLNLKSKYIFNLNYTIVDPQASKLDIIYVKPSWQWSLSPYLQRAFITDKSSYKIIDVWVNEMPISTWGTGMSVSAQYKRFVFSAGAGYSKVESMDDYYVRNYRNQYDTTYILNKRDYSTTKSGKELALVKEVIAVTTDSTITEFCGHCRSKIEYLDLPISIQYIFGNKRVRPYGELGSVVSLPMTMSGYFNNNFIYEDGIVQGSGQVDNDVNILVRASVAVGARVSVNSRWDIYSQIGYRVGASAILKGEYQKPSDSLWKAGFSLKL